MENALLRQTRRIALEAVAAMASVSVLLVASLGGNVTASAAGLATSTPSGIQSGIQGRAAGDASCPRPPVGIDLSTLSVAQLAHYGLLRRPTGVSQLTRWREVLRHSLYRYCATTPATGIHAVRQESGPYWAGNIATNNGYSEVSANWTVPCVASSPSSADSLTWVGIGGAGNDGGGNLVQAGTEQQTTSSGSFSYSAWYEDYPHDPVAQQIANFRIGCGDQMYVEVSNYSSGPTYYIVDYTSNSYFSVSESGYASNGSTAEWIDERPPGYTFPSFGSLTFSSAYAVQYGSALAVGQTAHDYAVMCIGGWWPCGPGSQRLAHPGPISGDGTSFTIYHDAS